MSLSPEIDLSSPELDDESLDGVDSPPTPTGSFSSRSSLTRDGSVALDVSRLRRNRAPSPPLEADEKGFTDMANEVKARSMGQIDEIVRPSTETDELRRDGTLEAVPETAEQRHRRDQELGFALFGHGNVPLSIPAVPNVTASPVVQPQKMVMHVEVRKEHQLTTTIVDVEMANTWDMRSPEDVELGELDGLFSDF